jgi:citrate synthase
MRLAMVVAPGLAGKDLCGRVRFVNLDSIINQPMLLSARETADRLGIKLDTLYAYVSRGLLRSVEIADSRERHYDADAVEHFRAGRGARGHARAETLVPVIGSEICLIENHRLYYRGEDAIALAATATLEDVAALLWEEDAPHPGSRPVFGEGQGPAPQAWESAGQLGLIERCQVRLAELAGMDLAALDLSRAGVARTGRLILGELAACVGDGESSSLPVHRKLAASWRLEAPAAELVRRCLVLLADHELNASTFVARCVASTGATPFAVISGALAALSGRRHGGASAQVEALARELVAANDPLGLMAARLARGEMLPGLGQLLYPEGDPRAAAILAAAQRALPQKAEWIERVVHAATRLTGERPNVDFGLGVAAAALGLPQGSALGIFLVARSVGWIAHAIEQYESGVLIRPRARYTGKR